MASVQATKAARNTLYLALALLSDVAVNFFAVWLRGEEAEVLGDEPFLFGDSALDLAAASALRLLVACSCLAFYLLNGAAALDAALQEDPSGRDSIPAGGYGRDSAASGAWRVSLPSIPRATAAAAAPKLGSTAVEKHRGDPLRTPLLTDVHGETEGSLGGLPPGTEDDTGPASAAAFAAAAAVEAEEENRAALKEARVEAAEALVAGQVLLARCCCGAQVLGHRTGPLCERRPEPSNVDGTLRTLLLRAFCQVVLVVAKSLARLAVLAGSEVHPMLARLG